MCKMGKTRLLIVEDEVILLDEMIYELEAVGYDVVAGVTDSDEALEVLARENVDVALLDIKLEGSQLDGIGTGKRMRELYSMPIIYLSSLSDQQTWEEAKATMPAAFLIKPFQVREVNFAIELALLRTAGKEETALPEEGETPILLDDRLFIKSNGVYNRLDIQDLLYVEADGAYSTIHARHTEWVLSVNLNRLFNDVLEHECLMRIHRSYVVNIEEITRFQRDVVFIGDVKIPIGKTYQAVFQKRFEDRIL